MTGRERLEEALDLPRVFEWSDRDGDHKLEWPRGECSCGNLVDTWTARWTDPDFAITLCRSCGKEKSNGHAGHEKRPKNAAGAGSATLVSLEWSRAGDP